MIKAVLFDLDGVLIETERETFWFYQDYLDKHYGITLKDSDFRYKAGRKSKDFWNDVLTSKQKKIVNTEELVKLKRVAFNQDPSRYVKKMDGAEKALSGLTAKGYLLAITSQNETRMVDTVVEWMAIKRFFKVILSIADIHKLKPDPEIYLKAASQLNVKSMECVVIEDSKDGVLSAKNAGMFCIGMRHPYTPEDALVKADSTVTRLSDIESAIPI